MPTEPATLPSDVALLGEQSGSAGEAELLDVELLL